MAILLAPEGSDPALVAALQETLPELAAQEGMQFETRPALSAAEIGPNLRIVVAVAPDTGISQ